MRGVFSRRAQQRERVPVTEERKDRETKDMTLTERLTGILGPHMERRERLEVALMHLVAEYAENVAPEVSVHTKLTQAIMDDNLAEVEQLLEDGCSPDVFVSNQRQSPLMLSLRHTNNKIFTLLLKRGAYPYSIDAEGNTLLHWAAFHQNQEAICRLLSWSRVRHQVNVRNQRQETALQVFCAKKTTNPSSIHVIQALLAAKATAVGADMVEPISKRNECSLRLVSLLLSAKADPDCKESCFQGYKVTPLIYACQTGWFSMVHTLLKARANPNTKLDFWNPTPLCVALHRGEVSTALALIQAGANVNTQDPGDKYPLHIAAKLQSDVATRVLLEHKANPNSKSDDNDTPLSLAIQHKKYDTAKTLIDAGAIVEHSVIEAFPVDEYFSKLTYELLTARCQPRGPANDTPTPLMIACRIGRLDIVHDLLWTKADVNETRDEYKTTPLHEALRQGNASMALALIQAGAHVNARLNHNHYKTGEEFEPLHFAAKLHDKSVTQALLNRKADPNSKSYEKHTPLSLAIQHQNLEVVQVLVAGGANVNLRVKHRCEMDTTTPLHCAASTGNNDILQLLLDEKANPQTRDGNNKTALYLAIQAKHTSAATLLWAALCAAEQKIDSKTYITLAMQQRNFDLARRIAMHASLDLTSCYFKGMLTSLVEYGSVDLVCALFTAGALFREDALLHCMQHHEDFMRQVFRPLSFHSPWWKPPVGRRLLRWGVSPNAPGQNYGLPLSCAVRHGDATFVQELLDQKAEPSASDATRDGNTALHLAVKSQRPDIGRLLLNARADPSFVNRQGLSPVDLARADQHETFLALLLSQK